MLHCGSLLYQCQKQDVLVLFSFYVIIVLSKLNLNVLTSNTHSNQCVYRKHNDIGMTIRFSILQF